MYFLQPSPSKSVRPTLSRPPLVEVQEEGQDFFEDRSHKILHTSSTKTINTLRRISSKTRTTHTAKPCSSRLRLRRSNLMSFTLSTSSCSALAFLALAAFAASGIAEAGPLGFDRTGEGRNLMRYSRAYGGEGASGGSSVYHGKRAGAKGFHEGIFDQGFGGFSPLKKKRSDLSLNSVVPAEELSKRSPGGSKGFHEGIFDQGFGGFSTLKKRDGSLDEVVPAEGLSDLSSEERIPAEELSKRSPGGSKGFHEGIFDQGFGGFSTLKKRGGGSKGFHEGIFDQGFGSFSTYKKKRGPEMTSRGMHGDAFTGGFGDFYTMKKRSDRNREADLFAQVYSYLKNSRESSNAIKSDSNN